MTGIPALLCTRRILADQRRPTAAAALPASGAPPWREPLDPRRRSTRSSSAPCSIPTARGCMLPAAAYLDDASWPGSARTSSPAPGCAPGASADLADAGRPAGRRRRRRRRAARARRRRRAARLLQRLPAPRPRAGAVRRDERRSRSIHCPYHGWRYGLDGALLSTPRFDAPDGFDRSQHGLVPVAVEEWHGWVMVNVTGDAPPLSARSSPASRTASRRTSPSGSSSAATHSYELAANWKLIVENYQECFHCPNIHPELCAVSPPTSGENHAGHDGLWVGGWQDLMPHAVTMSLDGRSRRRVPLRGLDGVARRRIDYLGLLPEPARQPAPRLRDDPPPRAARARPHGRRVPVAVRPGGRRPPTASTRRSRSTSGTSPTARTGRRARACSAASRRAATARARSPPTRTPSPSSSASSPRAYLAGGWTR